MDIRRRSARRAIGAAAATLLAYAALGMSGTASAAEVETHLFNATLSLTGNCATSAQDSVPDPSCPYVAPPNGPLGRFNVPRAVAVDSYGDVYVASAPNEAEGVIDVFDATGHFLTEFSEAGRSPRSIAVDSEGRMYVYRTSTSSGEQIVRYDPAVYEPEAGKILYANPPSQIVAEGFPINVDIAVDTSSSPGHKDHLFVPFPGHVNEYGSGAEGNPLISGAIGNGFLFNDKSIAINPVTHDIVVSDTSTSENTSTSVVKVFSGAPGHALIRTITGAVASPGPACPPAGHFSSPGGYLSIAIEAKTGHIFVYDAETAITKAVFEFNEAGTECISKIERSFAYALGNQIAIDNGANSPNAGINPSGGLNPVGSFLYVPSGSSQASSHLWAFEPKQIVETPEVKGLAASEVTATDAKLSATINPHSGPTHYTITYTPKPSFGEGEEFTAKEGDLPAELADIPISASITGLKAGIKYRFRVVAENNCETDPNPCIDEAEATFTTYSPQPPFPPCENDSLRLELGSSALLPDCRAYELVSPPDTGGRALFDVQHGSGGDYFGSNTAATEGDGVAFITRTGSLPGTEGAGGYSGTSYLASRNEVSGWETESTGPTSAQSSAPRPGGLSPDLGYSDTRATGVGGLLLEGQSTGYIRHPDGSFHLLGEGSEETDPDPNANYIAPNGTHILYSSSFHLEEESPAKGIKVIYDRTPDGTNHIVSRLPGEVVPSQAAEYLGSSYDGSAVAFKVGTPALSPLYVRLDNAITREAAPAGSTFAGLSADGGFAFYLAGGDLFRFNTGNQNTDEITTTGDATVVNVPASGDAVYFVSPSVLTSTEENPVGDVAQPGEENLYRWSGGGVSFVATLSERDVAGEAKGSFQIDGLGLWAPSLAEGKLALDPSRSSASGQTLIFESRNDLTEQSPIAVAQIYRYDAAEETLDCISCDPRETAASSGASLQTVAVIEGAPEPLSVFALIPNLSSDGQRAFFQTSEALLPRDTDGVQDVYEWEADGQGSCSVAGGCLYLISSGESARDNYLYGASASGRDVFVWTTDLLLRRDADSTPSIYDARVNGGFPETEEEEPCEGEGCRPNLSPPIAAPPRQSGPADEVEPTPKKKCPKSKRRVKRHGKYVCVAKHHKHKHHKSGRAGK
jgi:hypothetical protein